jgi:hypothetical protein
LAVLSPFQTNSGGGVNGAASFGLDALATGGAG